MHHSVRLYLLDVNELTAKYCYEHYFHTLSPFRQQKILCYHCEKDRLLSLGAGILVNQGLKEYGLCEANMTYSLNQHLKPSFQHYPDIHFNIAHSEQKVICAFSENEVGCDIEKIAEMDMQTVKRFFFPSEYTHILNQKTSSAQKDLFYRLWTLKESFLKITGVGMSLSMDAFCISIQSDKISVFQNINSQPYYFHEYGCESDYKIACCSHSNSFEKTATICHL